MGRIYYKESVVLAIFTWMENERVVLMNVDAESRVGWCFGEVQE